MDKLETILDALHLLEVFGYGKGALLQSDSGDYEIYLGHQEIAPRHAIALAGLLCGNLIRVECSGAGGSSVYIRNTKPKMFHGSPPICVEEREYLFPSWLNNIGVSEAINLIYREFEKERAGG